MDNLARLVQKATKKGCRLLIQFDPEESGEEWSIKFYPDTDNNAHFYALTSDLDSSARQLLDEMRGYKL